MVRSLNSKQTPPHITVEDELLGAYWDSFRKNDHNIYLLQVHWMSNDMINATIQKL